MDVLHAIERAALDHVDGAPAAAMLSNLAHGLGRTKIMLTKAGPVIQSTDLLGSDNVDPSFHDVVMRDYASADTNPFLAALPTMVPGRLTHFAEHVPWRTILSSAFYADFWEPTGVWHAGACLMPVRPGRVLAFSFGAERGRNWYAGRDIDLALAAVRAIERGVRLRESLDDARAAAGAGNEGDRVAVLVDRAGRLVHAPEGAAQRLEAFALVRGRPEHGGVLIAPPDARAAAALSAALRVAFEGRTTRVALDAPCCALIELSPGPCYVGQETAILRVEEPPPGLEEEVLRGLYGLTRREAEVAAALCTGCSTLTIAAALGLRIGSVRLYLKRAMAKCGVHSQAQLVARLIAGHGGRSEKSVPNYPGI